ncbi:MAG: YafY family protein [Myxococcota bacterium]
MLETSARLLRLLTLLGAQRFWTGQALAAQLEVTPRTLRRDVERLRSLGYPVESSGGVAGGYQLGAGAILPPLQLDDEEAIAVSLALRTVATGSIAGMEEPSLRALSKLERLLPKRLAKRMRAMGSAVALPWLRVRTSADVLTTLAAAHQERRVVTFGYADASGQGTEREVEPHGLVHTGMCWYLVAWDRGRDAWRAFRVDRIAEVPEATQVFLPRALPGGDVATYLARSAAAAPYVVRAKVIVHAPAERVAPKVQPSAVLVPDGPDRCVLEVRAPGFERLALYLASLGEELSVVEPKALEDAFERLAGRLLRAVPTTSRA